MSSILYYSNFCENCKELLSKISKSDIKKDLHFICIDKRIEKNGSIYVVLENNQQIVLPNTITSVPSILGDLRTYSIVPGLSLFIILVGFSLKDASSLS